MNTNISVYPTDFNPCSCYDIFHSFNLIFNFDLLGSREKKRKRERARERERETETESEREWTNKN